MLNDRSRTLGFLKGMRQVVCPGDTVLDSGTGVGSLAMTPARAGAGHVFAVETNPIAGSAQALLQAHEARPANPSTTRAGNLKTRPEGRTGTTRS